MSRDSFFSDSDDDDVVVAKPRVCVGVDEWVIYDKNTELLTWGLLNCVAVSATQADRSFLSHVLGGQTGETRTAQLRELQRVVEAFHGTGKVTLVYSGTEGVELLLLLQKLFPNNTTVKANGICQSHLGQDAWSLDYSGAGHHPYPSAFKLDYYNAKRRWDKIAAGFLSEKGGNADPSPAHPKGNG